MATNPEVYDYLLMIHILLFGSAGTGSLDSVNVSALTHAGLLTVTSYQHHGSGSHSGLDKAATSADAAASTVSLSNNQSAVSVTEPDAVGAYGAEEIALINELKADLNTLVSNFNTAETEIRGDVNQVVTDLNAVVTSVNGLKAVMRMAGLLTT
jgi:hypothetical protein